MPEHVERFAEAGPAYTSFRPDYPAALVKSLVDRMAKVTNGTKNTVLDVGSGTGIFTRQLTAALPADWHVVGIEPSATMRSEAVDGMIFHPRIEYIEGRAEALPMPANAASAIVAATAAYWFDRVAFYEEARRVLTPGGVLAILEYVRAPAESPAVAAAEEFLARYGEARAYNRPDYADELSSLNGFVEVQEEAVLLTFSLSLEQFVGLVLSSSHARQAVETLGTERATEILRHTGLLLAAADGAIAYDYQFQSFSILRA